MKLTIKDINRSQAIYKLLVEIDSDIVKLDKRAMALTEHAKKVELTFTFEGKPQVVDAEGDLVNGQKDYMGMMYLSIMGNYKPEQKKDTLDISLSDVESLAVLGFLINVKKQQRNTLIDELIKMGFDIH